MKYTRRQPWRAVLFTAAIALLAGDSTTCTAKVNDTDSGTPSAPTGTVNWSSSGSFSPASCTLAPTGNPG